MQASKMTKELMTIFLVTNLTLTTMWEHLSYKNMDKMKALLTQLSYYQVIWWTKSLSIYSVTVDMTPKEYLIYYLNIISAI